jgi:hypothetical protein
MRHRAADHVDLVVAVQMHHDGEAPRHRRLRPRRHRGGSLLDEPSSPAS